MLTRRKTGFVLHTIRLVKRYQFNYYLFTINFIYTHTTAMVDGVYSQYTQNNDGQLKGSVLSLARATPGRPQPPCPEQS